MPEEVPAASEAEGPLLRSARFDARFRHLNPGLGLGRGVTELGLDLTAGDLGLRGGLLGGLLGLVHRLLEGIHVAGSIGPCESRVTTQSEFSSRVLTLE